MNREDIDVTRIRITDTFRYGEQTFQGLEDLIKHSRHNGNVQGKPPYVVRKTESFPCFDSSDFMYENRFYQSYFLTMNKEKAAYIYEESGMSSWDFKEKHIEEQYPVMEPMFNMGRIEERICHSFITMAMVIGWKSCKTGTQELKWKCFPNRGFIKKSTNRLPVCTVLHQ